MLPSAAGSVTFPLPWHLILDPVYPSRRDHSKTKVDRLRQFQTQFGAKHRGRLAALPVVTLVCLVLLTLLTVVQVAHVHPVDTDADHCPLCIVLHTAAPVATTPPVIVLVEVTSRAPIFDAHTVSRPWHPSLFTRPPPMAYQG